MEKEWFRLKGGDLVAAKKDRASTQRYSKYNSFLYLFDTMPIDRQDLGVGE